MTNLYDLDPGPESPEVIRMIVEIPKNSANKYEYDGNLGVFRLDRPLYSPLHYPGDYGFVPGTLADDGDPLDVLVLMDAPVYPGCIVPSRLIGVIEAEQTEEGETERNDRLLAVAANSAAHRSIRQLSDLSQDLVAQIEYFFVSYNEMKGKRFEVKRRAGSKRARALVMAAMKRRR